MAQNLRMENARFQSPQINVVIALLLLLVIAAGLLTAKAYQPPPPPPPPPPITKWEYKIGSQPDATLEATMKKLGAEGWELVFARRAVSSFGVDSKGRYEMIFRRPLPPDIRP